MFENGLKCRYVKKSRAAAAGAEPATLSGDLGSSSTAPHPGEVQPGSGVHLVVEFCELCGFEVAYLELESAMKEQYPGIEIESHTGGPGAFEIQINRPWCSPSWRMGASRMKKISLRPSEKPLMEVP